MKDPHYIPLYTISDAARILRIPLSTLRQWHNKSTPLTFLELIEANSIRLLRTHYRLPMKAIKKACYYLSKEFKSKHPLALNLDLHTDGVELFVKHLEKYISATAQGQIAIKNIIQNHLSRVEHTSDGIPTRFYPFTRENTATDSPRLIMLDPRYNFGQLSITSRCIPTRIIYTRFRAGESPQELAEDYACQTQEIEEAIRAETSLSA